ncbi:MAG: methionyl-tRNA formyltransferase, partial [Gallionella sp.]
LQDAGVEMVVLAGFMRVLKAPTLTAFTHRIVNIHPSLLPKFPGLEAWKQALAAGESVTGCTVHYVDAGVDSGEIIAQREVPILPNDTALQVFQKVTVAAEMALHNVLPALLAGRASATKQDLSLGGYFGGRKAADGVINWSQSAREIHNLVRAVAPPYPGATTMLLGKPMRILQTLVSKCNAAGEPPSFYVKDGKAFAICGQGVLRVVSFELEGIEMSAQQFAAQFGLAKFEFNR